MGDIKVAPWERGEGLLSGFELLDTFVIYIYLTMHCTVQYCAGSLVSSRPGHSIIPLSLLLRRLVAYRGCILGRYSALGGLIKDRKK